MNKVLRILIVISAVFNIMALSAQRKIAPEQPKLIVNIVVEQMRYDILQRYWSKFSKNGFKKLMNEGTLCKNAYYNYL
ncbi:MAG: alkaline phosphatase family protein, partial [Bacteroidetes bacterium]